MRCFLIIVKRIFLTNFIKVKLFSWEKKIRKNKMFLCFSQKFGGYVEKYLIKKVVDILIIYNYCIRHFNVEFCRKS